MLTIPCPRCNLLQRRKRLSPSGVRQTTLSNGKQCVYFLLLIGNDLMTARMYQICVTLYDWEHICERFEGATHYAEKALYKLLSKHIVPEITAELRVSLFFGDLGTGYEQGKQEIQRKRQMEEAVSQRKRSSRLAIKESEKEEVRLTSLRKAEEEEKLSRLRRLEARQKREEEERLRREAAREKRRLDREERERRAQTEEEEKWVRFFPNLTHSLTFA